MEEKRQSIHGQWSSRWAFILAATGAAVGLGNVWKFPYVTGQNGGGIFVLIYLACMILIGIPLMIAEITLGRCGRQNPAFAMKTIAQENGISQRWRWAGAMMIWVGPLILTYYCVIAGWTLAYVFKAGRGLFHGIDAQQSKMIFESLIASPGSLLFWHSVIMVMTVIVVARGIEKGIEKTVNVMLPTMLVLLLTLVIYGMKSGYFMETLHYLFAPDFSELTSSGILVAMGQAFFSLSLATGTIMMYGAYLPRDASVASTAVVITLADTGVALLAGLAIFPIVFANHLEVGSGPGLIFMTLPIAFGQMPYGSFFAILFFLMLVFAAFTSTISLLEPAVAFLIEAKHFSRKQAAITTGFCVWLAGFGTIFSFNIGKNFQLFGYDFFGLLDYLTANLMLPLGGFFIAVFTAWRMKKAFLRQEMQLHNGLFFQGWYIILRYISPICILIVFAKALKII